MAIAACFFTASLPNNTNPKLINLRSFHPSSSLHLRLSLPLTPLPSPLFHQHNNHRLPLSIQCSFGGDGGISHHPPPSGGGGGDNRGDNSHNGDGDSAEDKNREEAMMVLLITGNMEQLLDEFKVNMKNKFEMNELGLLSYFLGMEITQSKLRCFVCQRNFTMKLLNKFAMENCKPVSTPMVAGQKLMKDDDAPKADGRIYRSLIGSLLYLTVTRPDIVFTVNYLSRFMQNPSQTHYVAAKRVLRYLKGTLKYGMVFDKLDTVKLIGFCDSDWAGSDEEMVSTSSYCFCMGRSIFCWNSKKQSVVAHSIAEAEYIVAYVAANQLVWLRKMLGDLNFNQLEPT